MHHLLLVTLEMPDNATSYDARDKAESLLVEDDSFCGNGGRFGAPLCDWFVIGGRWSGMLKEALLGEPYRTAFASQFPELANGFYTTDVANKHRQALNDLWHSFGGNGDNPTNRSGYDRLGGEDDAMLVDQALFDRFLAERRGESAVEGFADLDDEPVDSSFIGRKWLVIVDYHN